MSLKNFKITNGHLKDTFSMLILCLYWDSASEKSATKFVAICKGWEEGVPD